MLREIFDEEVSRYVSDLRTRQKFWEEIAIAYDQSGRYYHNFTHLAHLYENLVPHRKIVRDWDVIVFSIFYHDFFYAVLRSDNEERSAILAEKRLHSLSVPQIKIEKCTLQIRATKTHDRNDDADTRLFVDADMSILGSAWNEYWNYAQLIRKEFRLFPDAMFRKGRTRVLTDFLTRERLFQSDVFHKRYEQQARENLQRERDYWEEGYKNDTSA